MENKQKVLTQAFSRIFSKPKLQKEKGGRKNGKRRKHTRKRENRKTN